MYTRNLATEEAARVALREESKDRSYSVNSRPLSQEDPPEEETETHPSILVWEIPRTEEPGELQSEGSQSWTRLSD